MINMRNMNRLIVIFACLLALAPLNLSAQAKSATAKKAPMTYEAFFKKDIQKFNGTFPVYRNEGKYYLEIPASALGRDLLVTGSIVQGGSRGLVSTVTNLLVLHLGPNNTLDVQQQICSDRAKGDLVKAIEAANLKPVPPLSRSPHSDKTREDTLSISPLTSTPPANYSRFRT